MLCDVAWEDGSPVVASPRQVLAAQVERARAAGFEPMVGSELEFYLLKESYAEAHAQHYRDLTPSVPYILDYSILATTYDEGLIRQIRNGMQAAGIAVESSKGEAWPGQQEINFRYADALRMADNHVIYKNGAKEIAHAERLLDHVHGEARPHLDRQLVPRPHEPLARRRERVRRREPRCSARSSRAGSRAPASWRSSWRRRSTRTSATPREAGRRRRSPGAATTAPAASGSSVTAPRSASRRGSPAATSTRISRSPR